MLYSFLKVFLRFILFFLVKLEIKNIENFPKRGPVVIVANHTSLWDPVILGIAIPRKIHFMAKEELFKVFLLGTLIKKLGAFPVKRGKSDRNAIREALKVLKKGEVLCIFPEGTRSKTGELLNFQPGVTLIAYKGSAPILPVGLIGVKKILRKGFRPKIQINIGEVMDLKEFIKDDVKSENINELTALLHKKVEALLN